MKNIENHKKAAMHLEEAAKSHHEAVKHHEAGNEDKAASSTIKAHGHSTLAAEAQREVLKSQASKN
mgnify:CR=1 FL=1